MKLLWGLDDEMSHPLRELSSNADEQLHRLRRLCGMLPETWEKVSHGAPAFFSGKRMFASFDNNHHDAGHCGVWLAAQMADQEMLVNTEPRKYYRPPYVGCKGWLGVELGEVDDEVLACHLHDAWQLIQGKQKPTRR